MNRVELLPDRQIAELLDGIVKDIELIKGFQFMGRDVLSPTVNQTSNQYDLSSSLSAGIQTLRNVIVFTAETQTDPFIALSPRFYDLSGNELAAASFSNIVIFRGQVPGGQDGKTKDLSQDMPGTGKATMTLGASSATAFRVKVFVLATDTGSLSFI